MYVNMVSWRSLMMVRSYEVLRKYTKYTKYTKGYFRYNEYLVV